MGWGYGTRRNEFLAPYIVPKGDRLKSCTVGFIDANATFRAFCYGDDARTPEEFCRRCIGSIVSRWFVPGSPASPRVLIISFDNTESVHPERRGLHLRRYPNGAPRAQEGVVPYSDEELKKMTTRTRVVFKRMWASFEGKRRAWDLLYRASYIACGQIDHIVCFCRYEKQYFVHPPKLSNDPSCARFISEWKRVLFTEADQLTHWASLNAPLHLPYFSDKNARVSACVCTIDTDFILQSMCTPNWPDHYSSLLLCMKNETLDVIPMCRRFGGINYAFLLMMCGGVDYVDSITTMGWYRQGIVDKHILAGPSVVVTRRRRLVVLDIIALCGVLLSPGVRIQHSKLQARTAGQLSEYIHRLMFCICLFAGLDPCAPPYGGLPLCDTYIFGDTPPETPLSTSFLRNYLARSCKKCIYNIAYKQ